MTFLLDAEPGGDGENFWLRDPPVEMLKVLLGSEVFACRSGGDVGGFGIFGLVGNALFLL